MLHILPLPAVIVDLETTGSRASHDRITEIAIVTLEADGRVHDWSTLVNPGQPIPPTIQALTGISDAMVATAPAFEAIAAEVFDRLEGRLFIAHNARFDHGFLREAFARTGRRFVTRPLDTVRLSRALYPDAARHSLDSLIARHGLVAGDRHRALGDARALLGVLAAAVAEHGREAVAAAVATLRRRPSLPPYLEDNLDELPDAPGVYFFHGEDDALLYVGKSRNLSARVPAHFASGDTSARALRLAQQVRRVSWQETAGELSALLLEARLVKERQPLFNRRLRREGRLCTWRLREDDAGLLRPEVVFAADMTRIEPRMYGLFASPAAAKQTLRELAAARGLCLQATGLEARGRRPCSARQLRRCQGLCEGAESASAHNQRLTEALAGVALRTWPHPGPVGVVEEGGGRREIHVIDNWCWLGSVDSDEALAEVLAAPRPRAFDRDTYSLLVGVFFGKRPLPVLPLRYRSGAARAPEGAAD